MSVIETKRNVWVLPGVHTPFTRVDGGLAGRDAIGLGVPVVQAMAARVKGAIDIGFWGTVIPSLRWSNIARETWLDAAREAHRHDADLRTEGLLMAPAYGIPRLLSRNGLRYDDIQLWEIHEAFASQVLYHVKALDSREFVREKAGVDNDLGQVPRDRLNPNGGSVALGHPFGATGARILSQAIKELASRGAVARAIVSICADGGVGTVALLQA